MDFVQGLDPSKLLIVETVLSFVTSPFTAPPYNLAIFLFGTYAQENREAIQSLQTFIGLLGTSAILDIIWMVRNEQNGLIKFLTVVILLLKIPTLLSFTLTLRQRGSSFVGLGGSDHRGPTLWSIPGGFTSEGREGYQNVDEERPSRTSRPPAPPPSSQSQPVVPGTYQTV